MSKCMTNYLLFLIGFFCPFLVIFFTAVCPSVAVFSITSVVSTYNIENKKIRQEFRKFQCLKGIPLISKDEWIVTETNPINNEKLK